MVSTAPPRSRQNSGGLVPPTWTGKTEAPGVAVAQPRQDLGHRLHRGAREKDRCGKPTAKRFFDVDQQLGDVQRVANSRKSRTVLGGRRDPGAADRTELPFDFIGRVDMGLGSLPSAVRVQTEDRGQVRTLDLARSAPGERSDDDQPAGNLVGRQPFPNKDAELSGRHLGAITEHDGGGDVLAQPIMRNANAAASTTSTCSSNAMWILRGATFSPPRLISSLSRPVMVR